jgi:hypothetical protein
MKEKRRFALVMVTGICLPMPSHARLVKSRVTANPGEFVCGLSPRGCSKTHKVSLVKIHRVYRNLRLYWCDRRDCPFEPTLFKVDAIVAKEEYGYFRA